MPGRTKSRPEPGLVLNPDRRAEYEAALTVTPADDGMSAVVDTVAPGTARITVTADADLGAGVMEITGVSEDINVTLGTSQMASVMTLNLGAPADKA